MLRYMAAGFACLLLVCQTAAAQEVDEQAREEFVRTELKTEYQQQLLTAIQLDIDEMAELLQLPAAKLRRLELAAKGAATRAVEKHIGDASRFVLRQVSDPRFILNGRLREMPGNDRETPADDQQPQVKPLRVMLTVQETTISLNVRDERSSSGTSRQGGTNDVRNSDVWKSALESTLTPEQRELFETARKEKHLAAVVDLVTAFLAVDLRLNDTQATATRAWAAENIKEVQRLDTSSGTEWLVRRVLARVDPEGLKRHLSDAQYQTLQLRIADWAR